MVKLTHYHAQIEWEGFASDSQDQATVKLPNDKTYTIERISQSSMVPVKNGPFFTGSRYYLLHTPTGKARFESFDDLMQKGLGLAKEK